MFLVIFVGWRLGMDWGCIFSREVQRRTWEVNVNQSPSCRPVEWCWIHILVHFDFRHGPTWPVSSVSWDRSRLSLGQPKACTDLPFSTCQMLGIPKNVQLSCALQATSHQALPVRKGVIRSGRRGPLYYVDLCCSLDWKRFPGCSKRLFNAGWCLWGSSFERSRAAQTVLISAVSAIERVTIPLLCFLLSQILLFTCIRLYFPTLKAFRS